MKILLALFMLVHLAFATDGGDISGGGGISESNIIYSFGRLSAEIDQILIADSSNFSPKELTFLKLLKKKAGEESKTKLLFKSKKEFRFKGKSFVTGHQKGSDIYICLDKLMVRVGDVSVPFDYAQSFVFNLKLIDRDAPGLNTDGKKVLYKKLVKATSLGIKTYTLAHLGREELQLSVYNKKQLLIMDSNKLQNISAELESKLLCPTSFKDKKVLEIDNFFYKVLDEGSERSNLKIIFMGDIQYVCKDSTITGKVLVTLSYKLKSANPEIQLDAKWWEKPEIFAEADLPNVQFDFMDLMQSGN